MSATAVTAGYVLRPVTCDEVRERGAALIAKHYAESEQGRGITTKLAPDWNRLRAIEEDGALLWVAALLDEQIVGYAMGFVTSHLHNPDTIYFASDSLVLQATHRRGWLAKRLIRETERHARERGAKSFLWTAPIGSQMAKLLSVLKYQPADITFVGRI